MKFSLTSFQFVCFLFFYSFLSLCLSVSLSVSFCLSPSPPSLPVYLPLLKGFVTSTEQTFKVAFRKEAVGARFGDNCPRATPEDLWEAQWSIQDLTNFTDKVANGIWVCPPKQNCQINGKNGFTNLYSSPSKEEVADKVLLQLESKAQPIHANTYVCETDPYSSDKGDTFTYDLTIYGNSRFLHSWIV